MKIEITTDIDNILMYKFLTKEYIPYIKNLLLTYANPMILQTFDVVINNKEFLEKSSYGLPGSGKQIKQILASKQQISTYDLFVECVNNFNYINISNKYIIQIDFNKKSSIIGAKLLYIANLINYGNLEVRGCYIFTRVLQIAKSNYINMANDFLLRMKQQGFIVGGNNVGKVL